MSVELKEQDNECDPINSSKHYDLKLKPVLVCISVPLYCHTWFVKYHHTFEQYEEPPEPLKKYHSKWSHCLNTKLTLK